MEGERKVSGGVKVKEASGRLKRNCFRGMSPVLKEFVSGVSV